jgi:hypothetical protein
MKKLKIIVLMMFLSGILLSFTSCLVTRRHDNGKHYGWFKKHDNHHYDRGRTVRVYEYDNHHKQPVKKSSKSSKSNKSKKNQWDAKK